MPEYSVDWEDLSFSATAMRGGGTSLSCQSVESTAFPGLTGLLYKEYTEEVLTTDHDFRPQILEKRVGWFWNLSAPSRSSLLQICAHPQMCVRRGGEIVGFLMAPADDSFMIRRDRGYVPRDAAELGRKPEHASEDFPYFDSPLKLAYLGEILRTLFSLHSLGFIVGDLHAGNILISASQQDRRAFFIDCDSFMRSGDSPLAQRQPDAWRIEYPQGGLPTTRTDLAKFTLLACRALSENWSITDPTGIDFRQWMRDSDASYLERMWRLDEHLEEREVAGTVNMLTERLVRPSGTYVWRGKDPRIPWIPSSDNQIARVLSLANIDSQESATRPRGAPVEEDVRIAEARQSAMHEMNATLMPTRKTIHHEPGSGLRIFPSSRIMLMLYGALGAVALVLALTFIVVLVFPS